MNLLVQLSLAGLIDEPATHVSNLLRSGQPVEARTREALANALDGRSVGTKIQIRTTAQNAFVRRFMRRKKQLELGRRVNASKGMSRCNAVRLVTEADDCHWGESSVDKFAMFAGDFDAWVEKCRMEGLEQPEQALELTFLYADVKGDDPNAWLRSSIDTLQRLIETFEITVSDAEGLRIPRN